MSLKIIDVETQFVSNDVAPSVFPGQHGVHMLIRVVIAPWDVYAPTHANVDFRRAAASSFEAPQLDFECLPQRR